MFSAYLDLRYIVLDFRYISDLLNSEAKPFLRQIHVAFEPASFRLMWINPLLPVGVWKSNYETKPIIFSFSRYKTFIFRYKSGKLF